MSGHSTARHPAVQSPQTLGSLGLPVALLLQPVAQLQAGRAGNRLPHLYFWDEVVAAPGELQICPGGLLGLLRERAQHVNRLGKLRHVDHNRRP